MVRIGVLPPLLRDNLINGGRVQSIVANPINNDHIIVANAFGGLWKTENRGANWYHINDLLTVSARDVAYSPDGRTVIATAARDNHVPNTGGIWVSHDEGRSWSRPITGDPHSDVTLPGLARIPDRLSAYGISYSPDDPNRVYVGTDYGVAISTDNGDTWSHKMLDNSTRLWPDSPFLPGEKLQNAVISILALPNNKAVALSGTGVYRCNERFVQGSPWSWSLVMPDYEVLPDNSFRGRGNFVYYWYASCKNIDSSLLDNNKVFILKNYSTLFLYDLTDGPDGRFVQVALPTIDLERPSRGPFIRISRQATNSNSIDIWAGLGVNLWKTSCPNLESVTRLTASDWITIGRQSGLHDDTGYLGLDNNKRPLLYGCDGGLFRPTNTESTSWAGMNTGIAGTNSFQIADLAGTVVSLPSGVVSHSSLYFATQDNSIWASQDDGVTWPNNVCCEGHSLQVIKDIVSGNDVTVAFKKYDGSDLTNLYSRAQLVDPRPIPEIDLSGNSLSETYVDNMGRTQTRSVMGEAFFVSQNNWIRYRFPTGTGRTEIWISNNNCLNWRKTADVYFERKGFLTISGNIANPIFYAPFKSIQTTTAGHKQIIGLLRMEGLFDNLPNIITYNQNTPLIQLPYEGSLGIRATEFDWHAVFGVDPNNPAYIIAPDIYNQKVMVSRDNGQNWYEDVDLTKKVSRSGTLLLYGGDEYHMGVTHISFDPNNSNRIFIGTRDAGIVFSEDGGNNWTSIVNSERILYITNFFFKRNGDVLVSSYGRGLWIIDFHTYPGDPFPYEEYCLEDCKLRNPFEPEEIDDPVDWSLKDVIIFLNGRVNGLVISDAEVKMITVTPGTDFRRYTGISEEYHDLNIVESEKGEGFDKLEGCIAALKNDGVIKGVVLKENKIIGILSGKDVNSVKNMESGTENQQFKGASDQLIDKSMGEDNSDSSTQPYLFVSTTIPMSGESVIGNEGIINIFARGFKFDPQGNNEVTITIDEMVRDVKDKVSIEGTVVSQLRVTTNELLPGKHTIQVKQEILNNELVAEGSFIRTAMDDSKDKSGEE